MALDSVFHTLNLIFQVCLLDLILSGDNAVVIALACRSLPAQQVKVAMVIGTSAAIGFRVLLTILTGWLLQVPLLKLVGAVLLIVIAIRLLVEEEQDEQLEVGNAPTSLWGAVMAVLAADLVMSLDNVVALAAVTQGSALYLVFGLLLSVPLLMFGSKLMINLIHRYPILIPAGGALLGYIAGDIAVSDPVLADWVNTQSPALTGLVPLLCAVFVVAESRIIERRRTLLPRPAKLKVVPKSIPLAANASTINTASITVLPVQASAQPEKDRLEFREVNLPPQEQADTHADEHQYGISPEAGRFYSGIGRPVPVEEEGIPPTSEKERQETPLPEKRHTSGRLKDNAVGVIKEIAIWFFITILVLVFLPKFFSGTTLILVVGGLVGALLIGMLLKAIL